VRRYPNSKTYILIITKCARMDISTIN